MNVLKVWSETFLANCIWGESEKFKVAWDSKKFPSLHNSIRDKYLNKATNMLEFGCTYSDLGCFLSFCVDRKMREEFYKKYVNMKAIHAHDKYTDSFLGPSDNIAVAKELLNLRKYLGQALGYENYISYDFKDKMINCPQVIKNFLKDSLDAIRPIHRKNLKKTKDYARKKLNIKNIMPWDITYVLSTSAANITKMSSHQFDNYFELSRVIEFSFNYFEKNVFFEFYSY